MANGHVEIYDPISNHSNVRNGTGCDPGPTSDRSDMEDTVEFRILRAYLQRRWPQNVAQNSPVRTRGKTDANGTAPSQTPPKAEQEQSNRKKKKKKGWKRVLSIFKCVQPQTEETHQTEEEQPDEINSTHSDHDKVEEKDALVEVASRLTEIADEIPFTPPEIETDHPDDDVERAIGLILRESGDRLNQQQLKNLKELFWDYSFFRVTIKTLLARMGLSSANPDSPGPHASPKTQIAVACEAVSRLSALDTQPMNKLLGFGARYLNEFHSFWAKEQGGYEAAFESDDEDDIQ